MKKKIFFTLFLLSFLFIGSFAQGTLKENGKTISTIPSYDLSAGDTEWILNLNLLYSYKWSAFFNFSSITGTKNGSLTVFASADDGVSWVQYPGISLTTVNDNITFSFDDYYTVYDKLKFVFAANSITGGSVIVNQRLFSNPKF